MSESKKQKLELRLYILNVTPSSRQAVADVRALFLEEYDERFSLEIVDLFESPEKARQDDVIATPTLIKISPEPAIRVLGNFSDKEKVLRCLGLPGKENA